MSESLKAVPPPVAACAARITNNRGVGMKVASHLKRVVEQQEAEFVIAPSAIQKSVDSLSCVHDLLLHASAYVEDNDHGNWHLLNSHTRDGHLDTLIKQPKPVTGQVRDEPAFLVDNSCIDQHQLRVRQEPAVGGVRSPIAGYEGRTS
jgi:hypothetical protein